MSTTCRNFFLENRKSVFKNRKKKILIASRAFFRVKSRTSRPVAFDVNHL